MKTLKLNLEALQHSEGKSITWKSLKFQELAQIGDEKGSFEVLLGGTVSGALRRTGFEIGAGWLVLSPHPSACFFCSSGACLSDLLEIWSWEQLKAWVFSPLSFLMKQQMCLCTRNVLFKSSLLEFLLRVKVCVAYPGVSPWTRKCPCIWAPVKGLAKMLAVPYKNFYFCKCVNFFKFSVATISSCQGGNEIIILWTHFYNTG